WGFSSVAGLGGGGVGWDAAARFAAGTRPSFRHATRRHYTVLLRVVSVSSGTRRLPGASAHAPERVRWTHVRVGSHPLRRLAALGHAAAGGAAVGGVRLGAVASRRPAAHAVARMGRAGRRRAGGRAVAVVGRSAAVA